MSDLTIKCDQCGQFVSGDDLLSGRADRWLETPDSEFTAETFRTLCPKCNTARKEGGASMSDPLARRMVTCSWSDADGNCDELDEFKATCGGCNNGLVPEPERQWTERLKALCEQYMFDAKIECELREKAEAEARKWERIARVLADTPEESCDYCIGHDHGCDIWGNPDGFCHKHRLEIAAKAVEEES